jgi:2-polyprenyl-6-methoxyphenol hydroxylase-like FAD-dependent oxidoreductase
MNRPRTAIVIGGGVAGSASAIALQKAGLTATIYEAREEGGDTTGIMLTLGSNGIDALRAIDADAPVRGLGFATDSIVLRSHTGKVLGRSVVGTTAASGTSSRTVRRADLNRALQEHALLKGICVERGRRLAEIHERPDCVVAVFADGGTAQADLLIGADGVYSTVRRLIDPQAPLPRYSGLITTGGYAYGAPVDTDVGTYQMVFGKRAFFGFAHAPEGSAWWFVNVPHPREPARGELAAVTTSQWRGRFATLFADDAGPALELITATTDFAPMTAIHTVPPLKRWHRDRVLILGDAAHAPSPTSGQGASLAVEDAVVLARLLRDEQPIATAFARYEKARRPRVEKIVKAAARINNNKAPGPFGRVARDAVLPLVLRRTADSRASREVYEYHLDWDDPTPTTGSTS